MQKQELAGRAMKESPIQKRENREAAVKLDQVKQTIGMKIHEQVRFLFTQEKAHIEKTEEFLFTGALPKIQQKLRSIKDAKYSLISHLELPMGQKRCLSMLKTKKAMLLK